MKGGQDAGGGGVSEMGKGRRNGRSAGSEGVGRSGRGGGDERGGTYRLTKSTACISQKYKYMTQRQKYSMSTKLTYICRKVTLEEPVIFENQLFTKKSSVERPKT